MAKELSLLYVNGEQIGYGRVGVYLDEILTERGYTVYNRDGDPSPAPQTKEGELVGGLRSPTRPTNLTCLVSVPAHMMGFFDHQHRAIITMWEAMTLPEAFRENLHEFETVIVPSHQNVELFSRYHPNVHYMPLGVDPKLWHYIPSTPPTREFRFLHSGRGSRKGGDLVFRAFREVFDGISASGPAPQLIMKSRMGHTEMYGGNGVQQNTGTLSAVAERDLYASAHCYVQPSRGEGFGLQPLQALALGRPAILTDAHGHAAYAHLGIGIEANTTSADEFLFGDAGNWWEPDFEQLCEAMWDVYKNYSTHVAKAAQSAQEIAQHWTWDNTTDRFIEILGPEMTKPYLGGNQWIPSTRQLFPIIAWRDYACDIAGRSLMFRKGEEYWESADVKRILFDSGILDNACISDDNAGLAPIQVEQLGKYRADHQMCLTCGRECECPTAADRIEVEMALAEG